MEQPYALLSVFVFPLHQQQYLESRRSELAASGAPQQTSALPHILDEPHKIKPDTVREPLGAPRASKGARLMRNDSSEAAVQSTDREDSSPPSRAWQDTHLPGSVDGLVERLSLPSGVCGSMPVRSRVQPCTPLPGPAPVSKSTGIEASQFPTKQRAFQSTGAKLKGLLQRKLVKRSPATQADTKDSDAVLGASAAVHDHPRHASTTLPSTKLSLTSAPNASEPLKPAPGQALVDAELLGIRRVPGGSSQGHRAGNHGRGRNAPAKLPASVPGGNGTQGRGGPSNLRQTGGEDSEGDEDQPHNPQSEESTLPTSANDGPFYRCPLYAAKPDGSHGAKCRDWHTGDIPSVTRHVLTDLKKDPEKVKEIKKLSKLRLSPLVRWKKYFLICNDNIEDPEMNQPYWLRSMPEDGVGEILTAAMGILRCGSPSQATLLPAMERYRQLLETKRREDKRLMLECQRAITAAMEAEYEGLEKSQADLDRGFTQLMAGLQGHHGTQPAFAPPSATVPHREDLQGLTREASQIISMQRTASVASTSSDMNVDLDNPIELPQGSLTPMLPPNDPYTGSLRGGYGQDVSLALQQPISQLIADASTVVDPEADRDSQQQAQQRLSEHHRTPHRYYGPRYQPYPASDSGIGSSRPTMNHTTSSISSHDVPRSSFEGGMPFTGHQTQGYGMSPFMGYEDPGWLNVDNSQSEWYSGPSQ